jgi:hypothetical protein
MLRNGNGRRPRHWLTAATMAALTLVMMPLNAHCEENQTLLQILIKMASPQKAQKAKALACPSTPHCPMGVCTGAACPWYCPSNCHPSNDGAMAPTSCAPICNQRINFIPCPATVAACAALSAAVDGPVMSCPAGCTNCPATCTKCQAGNCPADCTNCPSGCPANCTKCKLKEAKIKKIFEMYAVMMKEGKYKEAYTLAIRGLDLDPENVSLTAAATIAGMKMQEHGQVNVESGVRAFMLIRSFDKVETCVKECDIGYPMCSSDNSGRTSQQVQSCPGCDSARNWKGQATPGTVSGVQSCPGCDSARNGSCERAACHQEVMQMQQLCVEQQNTLRQMATMMAGMQRELAAMRQQLQMLRTMAQQYPVYPLYPNPYGNNVPLNVRPVNNYGWGVDSTVVPTIPTPNQN